MAISTGVLTGEECLVRLEYGTVEPPETGALSKPWALVDNDAPDGGETGGLAHAEAGRGRRIGGAVGEPAAD